MSKRKATNTNIEQQAKRLNMEEAMKLGRVADMMDNWMRDENHALRIRLMEEMNKNKEKQEQIFALGNRLDRLESRLWETEQQRDVMQAHVQHLVEDNERLGNMAWMNGWEETHVQHNVNVARNLLHEFNNVSETESDDSFDMGLDLNQAYSDWLGRRTA